MPGTQSNSGFTVKNCTMALPIFTEGEWLPQDKNELIIVSNHNNDIDINKEPFHGFYPDPMTESPPLSRRSQNHSIHPSAFEYGVEEDPIIDTEEVLERIEHTVMIILKALDEGQVPEMVPFISLPAKKKFTLQQSRSFTSMVLVMAYCHALLSESMSQGVLRTTTTREVYYFYVTHFRSQRECDAAIRDVAQWLHVPRHALGLQAGSRGWFCGDIQLLNAMDATTQWNGRTYQGEQGCPIAADWLRPAQQRSFSIHPVTTATCILVVEKEGIYQRLVQDGFCRRYNCILITGKGFPDFATRACLRALHRQWQLPIYGLADCDPFGVAVLHSYGLGPHMQWLGLRPSQVDYLSSHARADKETAVLPAAVFQELTALDRKRLEQFCQEEHPFVANHHPGRIDELELMRSKKVELEALHWLGMQFCGDFVGQLLEHAQRHGHDDDDALWVQVL
jgi:meiotic recombination protein SPO11